MLTGKRSERVNGYGGSFTPRVVLLRLGPFVLVAALWLVWGARRCGSEQSRPPARARTVVWGVRVRGGVAPGSACVCTPGVGLRTCDPHAIDDECYILFYDTLGFTSAPRSGAVA